MALRRLVTAASLASFVLLQGATSRLVVHAQPGMTDSGRLSDGQHLFYSGRYEAAAAVALAFRASDLEDLATYELRTSALHFQIKRALGDSGNKSEALQRCGICPALMSDFFIDTTHGQSLARAKLLTNPRDESAMFFLGKLDLNYVWLQLGTLGKRTGWDQYWEARRSLDAVLKQNPAHVRARVARAWIDYIVDTKLPRGTKWLLGGGNKRRALLVVRDAAEAEVDFYIQAEAGFALWEMLVRERNIPEAIVTAHGLARHFPENEDLVRFLAAHDPDSEQ